MAVAVVAGAVVAVAVVVAGGGAAATAVFTRNDGATGAGSCQLRRPTGGVTPTPMPAMDPCRGGRVSGDSGDGAASWKLRVVVALWFRREAALRASSSPASSRRSSSRAAASDMRTGFRLWYGIVGGFWTRCVEKAVVPDSKPLALAKHREGGGEFDALMTREELVSPVSASRGGELSGLSRPTRHRSGRGERKGKNRKKGKRDLEFAPVTN